MTRLQEQQLVSDSIGTPCTMRVFSKRTVRVSSPVCCSIERRPKRSIFWRFSLFLVPDSVAPRAYCLCVVHLRLLQGGLKTKRLSQLIAPLRGESLRRGLGDTYRLVGLRELRLGRNMGVAVALKVNFYDKDVWNLLQRCCCCFSIGASINGTNAYGS